MANFVSPSRPIIEDWPGMGPAFCSRIVLRPEDELAGGCRASSAWKGSTGIGARDEADLDSGSEQNTQQEEAARERSVIRRRLEEVDRFPDLSSYLLSPLISVILVISVVKGECLALSSSRLHLDKFLSVSFPSCRHFVLSRTLCRCRC